jgi:hypothetical protein
MEYPVEELLRNHVKRAVSNGLIVQIAVFVLGALVGWSVGTWDRNRVEAISVGSGAGLPAIWFIWAYYRTGGLLHHGGLGNSDRSDQE